jgi:hypothetical protein
MKIALASLGASLLIACGSEPGANATMYVDPPPGDGCIGVAGFEVIVSPTGKVPLTASAETPATILAAADCKLPRSISVPDLDIHLPVSVKINGFDGSGKLRVSGEKGIMSLNEGPVHLELKAQQALPPLLVFDRKPYLADVALSEVTSMTISFQMGMMELVGVNPADPGVFFNPEPGAYGSSLLAQDGSDKGDSISVVFTAGTRTIQTKLTLEHNGRYYTARP